MLHRTASRLSVSGRLVVDLGAVQRNYLRFAAAVDPAHTAVGGVVKADAYGLGVASVAPALAAVGCRNFFVVFVDEGVALRQVLGPGPEIVLMGGFPLCADPAVTRELGEAIAACNLTPAVNSLAQLKAAARLAKSRNFARLWTAGAKRVPPMDIERYPPAQQVQFLQRPRVKAHLGAGKRHDKTAQRQRRLTLPPSPLLAHQPPLPGMLPVYLQLETGMTRYGYSPDEVAGALARYAALTRRVHVRAVMSHLACADDPSDASALMQLSNFTSAFEQLRAAAAATGTAAPFGTLANSVGVMRDRRFHFDLIRPGMGLYGLSPVAYAAGAANPMELPVRVDAMVGQTRFVPAGTPVGYSATERVKRDSCVATVGIGYADGLLRSASNRGLALWWPPPRRKGAAKSDQPVAAYRLPLLGRISMDSCVVDLTSVPEGLRPAEGQMVEVIGPNQHPEVVASAAGTIGYEVLTSLGRRFRREYVQ